MLDFTDRWAISPSSGNMNNYALTVYLAGSVAGHSSLAAANEWRVKAANILEAAGYCVLNPLRGKEDGVDYCPNRIVLRDLCDIAKSDILLVEMAYEGFPYIGTSMEIRAAHEQEKEIILWGTAHKNHYWLRYHATKWFDTLDVALRYLTEGVGGDDLCLW